LSDPQYQRKLRDRLLSGKLPPPIEALLHYYAWGKPKEILEVASTVTVTDDIRRSLNARIQLLGDRLRLGATQEPPEPD